MNGSQLDLFGSGPSLPAGFRYQPGLVSPGEERSLIERFTELPFQEFEFRGYVGRRRTVSFGWEYDFSTEQVRPAQDIPDFLLRCGSRPPPLPGWQPATCHMPW
jgi:hypothetical protein